MDSWQTLEDERLAFADLLDTLTPEQWDTPSLCGDWTVAEVATHMLVGPTGSLRSFTTAVRLAELTGPGADGVGVWAKGRG